MLITATVTNRPTSHEVSVTTDGARKEISIARKPQGRGSAVNGGEFLMLALATCYCNDLYREAQRLGITVESVEVEASASFAGVGLAASNITYRARVESPEPPFRISELLRATDAVAEVHNTIRSGVPVSLLAE